MSIMNMAPVPSSPCPSPVPYPFEVHRRLVPQPPRVMTITQPDKIEKDFLVRLTAEEVVALRKLCANTGGPPSSLRAHIDSLSRKLPKEAQMPYGQNERIMSSIADFVALTRTHPDFLAAVAAVNAL